LADVCRTIASETGMSPGHGTAATVAAAAAIRVPLLLRHKCMLNILTWFLSTSRAICFSYSSFCLCWDIYYVSLFVVCCIYRWLFSGCFFVKSLEEIPAIFSFHYQVYCSLY